jgi:hypothetical protein
LILTFLHLLPCTLGSYTQELYESSEVLIQRARVAKFLDETEINANKLRDYFKKFEYLWKTDINVAFETFLATAVTVTWVPYQSDASLPVGMLHIDMFMYI